MDDNYQTYINRVAPMTLPAIHSQQLQNMQQSAKFQDGKPLPFPGYSVITPTAVEDPDNQKIYTNLSQSQQQLLQELPSGLLIPVTPESFHLTIADLIWDSGYRDAIEENPQFEQQLQERIAQSFQQYQESIPKSHPIQFQVLGLTVFPRALVVCLVPKDEFGYEEILFLRRSIYQNPGLIALGIEQQYYFTAHITLGYFGTIPPELDREKLVSTLDRLNQQWFDAEPQILTVYQAELRKFEDMLSYHRESDWPTLKV